MYYDDIFCIYLKNEKTTTYITLLAIDWIWAGL